MTLTIKLDSAQLQQQIQAWGQQAQREIYAAAAEAMKTEGQQIALAMQQHAEARLQVQRRSFAKSFKARVYAKRKDKPPMLIVGSKIPWIGLHEYGGTLNGKMLIPFGRRIGRKQFKQIISTLMRSGNAFFQKTRHGKILLFAENIAENDRALNRFKRAHRQATGQKTLKRGAEIPIAQLVTRVQIKRRLEIRRLVASQLPALRDAIHAAAQQRFIR
ncbi:DUF6441 family protein [Chitinibacter sp. GC72]|uniref:DUF6441 family protein n=1 Tax=Chitinibacter sp. GC72 TaxID=1526917 RepID=UPI0012F742CA|nr:DUF6441 family protein [Chitinibacter sp. GC72]